MDRPEFVRLSTEIENGKINTVIVKDLSRLGRNNPLVLLQLQEWERMNVRFIAIDNSYDSYYDSNDTIGITTWFNEFYIKDISRKIRSNIQELYKKGTYKNKIPFGYVREPITGNIMVDEETRTTVQNIFHWYLEGNGSLKITRLLMGNDYDNPLFPTPSMILKQRAEASGKIYRRPVTKTWTHKTIITILKDDFYIGILRLGEIERDGINGKPVKKNSADHYVFEDNHPAIIDKKTYLLVQDMIKSRNDNNYRGTGMRHVNILSGKIFCKDCGHPMNALNIKGRKKSYICSHYDRYGKTVCTRHHIREEDVFDTLKMHLVSLKNRLIDIIDRYNKSIKDKIQTPENYGAVLVGLKRKLQIAQDELRVTIMEKIKAITKNPSMADVYNETYESIEKEKQAQISIINDQIKEIELLQKNTSSIEDDKKTALQIFDDILNKEIPSRRDLEVIISKIVIDSEGNTEIKISDNLDLLLDNVAVGTYALS